MEFTIVLPVYRGTTYFREALDSVLAQTVGVKIVVHDASPTDVGFRELIGADSDRVEYHYFPDSRGIGGDWNRAMSLVKTEWFAFLHQDDWLEPDFCASFLADLEKAAPFKIWLCSTSERGEGAPEHIVHVPDLYTRDRSEIGRLLLVESVCRCAGVVLNRRTTEEVGEFDVRMKHTLDSELFVRVALAGGAYFNSEVLAYHRIHPESTTGMSRVNKWGMREVPILEDHRLLDDHRIFILKQTEANLGNKYFRLYSSNMLWCCFRYYLKRMKIRSLYYWFQCWKCHLQRFVLRLPARARLTDSAQEPA